MTHTYTHTYTPNRYLCHNPSPASVSQDHGCARVCLVCTGWLACTARTFPCEFSITECCFPCTITSGPFYVCRAPGVLLPFRILDLHMVLAVYWTKIITIDLSRRFAWLSVSELSNYNAVVVISLSECAFLV